MTDPVTEAGHVAPSLAPAVGRALTAAILMPGDVLLVSSGRTVDEVARFELPKLPGVLVAPTVGGTDQPEGWFQTNEITRRIAHQVGGRARYLFAPALPGPDLDETLIGDPTIQRVLHLWPTASCVMDRASARGPAYAPAGGRGGGRTRHCRTHHRRVREQASSISW